MMILTAAIALSLAFVYLFKSIAPTLRLIADVGEHRQHEVPTPVVGGIAMFLAVLVAILFLPISGVVYENASASGIDSRLLIHYFSGAGLLVLVGALDDRFHLPFVLRFIAQIVAVFIMVSYGNTLHSLGELFSSETLLLGKWAVPMTIFATVGVINAINMTDGIDGLAASFVLIAFIALSFFQFNHTQSVIMLAWIGALLGFLVFNLRVGNKPARVFMGDAGSTVLGYTLAWLFIYGSQQAVEEVAVPRLFAPIFSVWIIALPLYETVSLMLLRLIEGKSPFHADRGHIHHHLLDKTKSVNKTLLILLLWFAFFVVLGCGLHLQKIESYMQTYLFAGFFVLHLVLQYKIRQKNCKKRIV